MATTPASQPWGDNASFRMIDVGDKAVTQRRAVAQGTILLSTPAFAAVRDHKNPKGNVLALAEVAGIQAAKKRRILIPLCHPLPLSSVRFEFKLSELENSITVFCEARATATTGVEMEALAGVNGALLTVYDLSKAVNPELTLSEIRLNVKEGGKSGTWFHPRYQAQNEKQNLSAATVTTSATPLPLAGVRVGALTISDSVSQKTSEDRSGIVLADHLKSWGCDVHVVNAIPDQFELIQKSVLNAIETQRLAILITTGGTGLSPRDVTPEALQPLCSRLIPGFGEMLRQDGARHIPTAWLSRSFAGMIGPCLVIALPGSPKAVAEGLEVLKPLLPHALFTLTGARHD